ncbi:CgeB family protein [Benzoatithermus flavus]|uniref:Glycosyltransferase n=1 Tax=Benzoatithermus flavus TaxID=3108223 RepID=A0ABU8XSC1_9PROT
MRIVLFCHSLQSCWNHGNAHFLRGIARELLARGHDVRVHEPVDGWSRLNLVRDHGEEALLGWRRAYPELSSESYAGLPDLDAALDGADLVLVHEWNPPELVAAIGQKRLAGGRFVLLFHDTHHRTVSDPEAIRRFVLDGYDGVLAFGACLAERYRAAGWAKQVRVWHEAADTRLFRPLPGVEKTGDLVWIGNWGDDERSEELEAFLTEPVRALGLAATVYGVRYPETALDALEEAGIAYRGWLPNHEAPLAFARHRVTVHVPRRPYVEALPGIPTIRVFEALACGIPLVSAPWRDTEGLFPEGSFLLARDGAEMARHLRAILHDADLRAGLIATGLAAIRERHSCAHRVDELLAIHAGIAGIEKEPGLELRPCA